MGTALTEEQLRELERIARVLELCLDADGAGQEAMLRAARLAAGRSLELRVVALPEGTDPAELVQREGADAVRELVRRSVPFVVFQVQQILDRADTGSAEGRDRAFTDLRPVIAEVPPSSLRDELVQRVAGRLELPERRLESLLASAPTAGPGSPTNGGPPLASSPLDHGVRAERTFLVLCIAVPDAGEAALAATDPDEHLTSEPLRRAARHLAGRLNSPLAEPPEEDDLAVVISDLVKRAARYPDASRDRLEHARLVLELARLDRAIRRARGVEGGADTSALAHSREEVLKAVRAVVARLEKDG
jgi:DNA primase